MVFPIQYLRKKETREETIKKNNRFRIYFITYTKVYSIKLFVAIVAIVPYSFLEKIYREETMIKNKRTRKCFIHTLSH